MRLILENWRRYLKEQQERETVIFMAGGPGSGKSTVLRKLGIDLTVINADDFYEQSLINDPELSLQGKVKVMKAFKKVRKELEENPDQPELERELARLRNLLSKYSKAFNAALKAKREMIASRPGGGFVIDGTGGDIPNIRRQKKELEEEGYNVAMIFVDVDMDTAIERNRFRGASGGRELLDAEVIRSHESIQKNKPTLMSLFGDNFIYVNATDEETLQDTVGSAKDKIRSLDSFIVSEDWSASERNKRKKSCANPKGFTMKQFCKNQKSRSKKGERKNESFQSSVKRKHSRMKKRLIGGGGNEHKPEGWEKVSYKRSKSAPPGFAGA